ncbi:hypothetical protein EON65_02855 [archaeon]|nr:MAG: hypothetical protein EON65_02855 [archaeon]
MKSEEVEGVEASSSVDVTTKETLIGPVSVIYCAVCSMPPEFCEYGACFDKCLPWILENCREALSPDLLARNIGALSLEEGKSGGEVSLNKYLLLSLPSKYINISYF